MGRELSWQYVRDNWQKIKDRFTGSFLLQRLVSSVCSEFASEERAKEVEVCMGEWLVVAVVTVMCFAGIFYCQSCCQCGEDS